MKIQNLVVGLLAIVVTGAQAQVGLPCHSSIFQFTPRHGLNISEYMGKWFMHEIAGSHIGNFPAPSYKCAERSLSLPNKTDITRIVAVDEFLNTTTGGGTVLETIECSINNTRSPFTSMWYGFSDRTETESDIIILFADLEFKEWTVVYSCTHLPPDNYRYETLTAMTRSRNITPKTRRMLKALMVGQGFRIGDHHPIDQSNCY